MEIGWTDVGSGGYILVSCAHSNTSCFLFVCCYLIVYCPSRCYNVNIFSQSHLQTKKAENQFAKIQRLSTEVKNIQGRIQDFKLGGALKKIGPSGGRREIFGVFRVKNHDFTPKNHIFSNFRPPPLNPPLISLNCMLESFHTHFRV